MASAYQSSPPLQAPPPLPGTRNIAASTAQSGSQQHVVTQQQQQHREIQRAVTDANALPGAHLRQINAGIAHLAFAFTSAQLPNADAAAASTTAPQLFKRFDYSDAAAAAAWELPVWRIAIMEVDVAAAASSSNASRSALQAEKKDRRVFFASLLCTQ